MFAKLVFEIIVLAVVATAVTVHSIKDFKNLDANYVGTVDTKHFYTNLGNDGMSYFAAIDFCLFFGMKPAIINSTGQDDIIYQFLDRLPNGTINSRPFWLALSDVAVEGKFVWYDGSAPDLYTNWAEGSPLVTPDDNNVDCVSVQKSTGLTSVVWINLPCGTTWRPLCERSIYS